MLGATSRKMMVSWGLGRGRQEAVRTRAESRGVRRQNWSWSLAAGGVGSAWARRDGAFFRAPVRDPELKTGGRKHRDLLRQESEGRD